MPVKNVVTISDLDRGQPCVPIDEVNESVRALIQDLRDTMYASPACVGLAAPQIGDNRRAFVVDVSGHKKTQICHGEIVMLNPEVLVAELPELAREGCMSVPDLTGDVARATRLIVRGLDEHGNTVELTTDAFEARAILHEIDHLDGLVFLDRLSGPNALHARRVYK